MSQSKLKKHKKKEYWGKPEEAAVKTYLKDPDSAESGRLFNEIIYPALRKLVENICFTYKLTLSDEPIKSQVDDTIGYVVTKLDKFDPEKGTKSFSYYGTVAKNYMIMKKKKSYNKKIETSDIENLDGMEFFFDLFVNHPVDERLDSLQYFLSHLADVIENNVKEDLNLHQNTVILSEALVYILRHYTVVPIPNKNALYFIIREMTGLQTKEITKALKDIKPLYQDLKEELG